MHEFILVFSDNTRITYKIDTSAENPWVDSNTEVDKFMYNQKDGLFLKEPTFFDEYIAWSTYSFLPDLKQICSEKQLIMLSNTMANNITKVFGY